MLIYRIYRIYRSIMTSSWFFQHKVRIITKHSHTHTQHLGTCMCVWCSAIATRFFDMCVRCFIWNQKCFTAPNFFSSTDCWLFSTLLAFFWISMFFSYILSSFFFHRHCVYWCVMPWEECNAIILYALFTSQSYCESNAILTVWWSNSSNFILNSRQNQIDFYSTVFVN